MTACRKGWHWHIAADLRDVVRHMEGLYLGGVVDFGRRFAHLHRQLEALGFGSERHFVLVSDHGEAFLEHENIMHKGPVYEEQTRIPWIMAGPGIERGRVDTPVSLLDLAPTIAELAGIDPDASWAGRSVLAPPADARGLRA